MGENYPRIVDVWANSSLLTSNLCPLTSPFSPMDVAPASSDSPRLTAGRGLLSPSFLGLLVTQFLTAVNDNIFRWLVIGIGKDHVEAALQSGSAPS